MDIQKIAVGVCAVGTACVVGGTAVVDQVTNGSEKRREATVEAVVEELKPFIKEQIELSFPSSTGGVIGSQQPQVDYRKEVNGTNKRN
tara:strand:+ start:304 stop:567 length:264 start_codon:yes stop_codon:yes gene_type:complete